MSSINSESAGPRGQHGDRTSSELEESEGVRTEMTSLSEADVVMEGVEEVEEAEEAEEAEGLYEFNGGASIYPSSMMTRRLESNIHLRLVGDSAEEDSIDLNASTRSLMERYLDYHERNGRRYCQHYFMPNDELEQTRLYLTHQVFLHVLNGEITTIPLKSPTRILDIGTGTGEWAMQMGERLPDCEIIGTDLSAIQPNCPPINVFFEIEDAELPWLRQPDSIDLIHLRNMSGAFRDWRFIYEQAFECLKPGGYLEIQEFDDGANWSRFLPAFPPDSPVHAVARDLFIGCAKVGRPRGMGHVDAMYWIEAGFVDVKTTEHVLPLNMESGSAGKLWLMTVVDGFEALCLRPLTEYMGWDPEYAKKCCEEIAYDIARIARDPERSKGLTATVRVVSGRKPTAAEWVEYEGRIGQETESTSDGRTVVADMTLDDISRTTEEADATMQDMEDLHSTSESGPGESSGTNAVMAVPEKQGPDSATGESGSRGPAIAGATTDRNGDESDDTSKDPIPANDDHCKTSPLVVAVANGSEDTMPIHDTEPGPTSGNSTGDDLFNEAAAVNMPGSESDAMQIDAAQSSAEPGCNFSISQTTCSPPTSAPTSESPEIDTRPVIEEKEIVYDLVKSGAAEDIGGQAPLAEGKSAHTPFHAGDKEGTPLWKETGACM